MALLEIDKLSYFYPDCAYPALDDVSLQINEGELVLLVGGSGSGKTTLLRVLSRLIPDFYGGLLTGEVLIAGRSLTELSRNDLLQNMGMVYENPENQLVMTTVEQELAFGLENLGLPMKVGLKRMAEAAEALGLDSWMEQAIASLSGGQKQKTALAAVMALRPRILLLDEPTSRLDPVASEELFGFLRRLNEENGLTIIMAEHRLERCYHLADRVVYLESGQIAMNASPEVCAQWAARKDIPFIPSVPKLFAELGSEQVPLTVKQGRSWLGAQSVYIEEAEKSPEPNRIKPALAVNNLSYSYPGGPPILKKIDLELPSGSITALMGANGAGKSTLCKTMVGLLHPQQGSIYLNGQSIKGDKTEARAQKIGYLPQETSQYFFLPTVEQEIAFNIKNLGRPTTGWYNYLAQHFTLPSMEKKNPRDLSKGEQQKVALACVLMSKPAVLLMDEPTQGLDHDLKRELGRTLQLLEQEGITILMITHDIEFAAEYADRAAFIHKGQMVGIGSTREMLCGNTFYSPQINRLLGGNVLTVDEALSYCGRTKLRQ